MIKLSKLEKIEMAKLLASGDLSNEELLQKLFPENLVTDFSEYTNEELYRLIDLCKKFGNDSSKWPEEDLNYFTQRFYQLNNKPKNNDTN